MDNPFSAQSLSVQRPRLSRPASLQFDDDNLSDLSQAGPSRTSISMNDADSGDPKSSSFTANVFPHNSYSPENNTSAETPAARLRALLSRIPNTSPPNASGLPPPHPPLSTPSEVESESELLQSSPTASRSTREGLKNLFSRALREPGDTPRKERQRRNSVDVSEVEATPRVEMERLRNKGKRKSMSDEEAERPYRTSQQSEGSVRSSNAATFDSLRERLINSHSAMKAPARPLMHEPYDSDAIDTDHSTEAFLRDLNTPQGSPPVATSTPHRTLHLTSQMPSQSNLLEPDSEMQRAMERFESSEGESGPSSRQLLFPPPAAAHALERSHSEDLTPGHVPQSVTGNVRSGAISRASSINDSKRSRRVSESHSIGHHSKTPRPQASQPGRDDNGSRSPLPLTRHGLSRKTSTGSLSSLGDDTSSQPSSVGSQAEYRDRMKSAEQEHHHELERRWNQPRPKLSPSPSTSSSRAHSERIRTQSNPTRPDSPIAHPKSSSPTPKRHGRHRTDSATPDSGLDQEVDRFRERNWNAVHPKWSVPASPTPPRAHSPSQAHHSRSHSHHLPREANHHATGSNGSLGLHPSAKPSGTHSTASSADPATMSRDGAPGSHSGSVYTERHNFTFPSAPDSGAHSSNKTPASSRFEWQPPRSRTPLPPLELDDSPRQRVSLTEYHARNSSSPTPSSRSLNRTAEPLPVSHIPVKSPKTRETPSTSLVNGNGHAHGETNHKRTAAEIIDIDEILTHLHGEDSDEDLPSQTTPTIKSTSIPPASPPRSPPPRKRASDDQARLQKTLASLAIRPDRSPPSPDRAELPTRLGSPPLRPLSFASSGPEYRSISPLMDPPELPGPPSSSGEEAPSDHDPSSAWPSGNSGHLMAGQMTPKPPGGWTATPARPRSKSLSRSAEPDDSQYGGDPATPTASLKRMASLPPQTPAPPGAWSATPGRKSILKVRFDVERSEPEVSTPEGVSEQSRYFPGALKESPAVGGAEGRRSRTPEPRETTIHPSPRSHRKSPGIRVVDAYGVEQGPSDSNADATNTPVKANGSFRNKSAIRIVDAMGRQVDDASLAVEESIPEDVAPLDRHEVVTRVRQGLADLLDGLDERDRSSDTILQVDHQRLAKLEEESQEARLKRRRISETLYTAQNAEEDLKSRFWSLKAALRKGSVLPILGPDRRFLWISMKPWVFWGLVILQLSLVLFMYHLSTTRARNLFFTTYYDPFYADLHAYTIKPEFDHYSMSLSMPRSPWSVLSLVKALDRGGWTALAAELRHNLASFISRWQQRVWDTWGADATAQNSSWPPT